MPEQFLAIADADKIHDYVFSPHELKLIKGGSFLQYRLNTETLPMEARKNGDKPDPCISANGGTVVAKFSTRPLAEGFCRTAETVYRKRTAAATVSTAVARYPKNEWVQAKRELDDRLEQDKHSRRKRQFNGASPLWTTCQACGLYPAAHPYYTPSDKRWICRACRIRKDRSNDPPEWFGTLPSAETFEDIGGASHPDNYIGFLYVDLDRLGRFIQEQGTTEDRWKALSSGVDEAVRSSVSSGCRALDGTPCQVLLAGGDDAIVALPADQVFRFVRGFQEGFQGRRVLDVELPAYSMGLILANSHYPIFEFRRLAEELMRSAKRIEGENSIDFEILTASMTDSITDQRDRMARRTLGPRRTAKPYTIKEFLRLEATVGKLKEKGVPSSKVKSLYRMVYQGKYQADLDYLYLLSRLEATPRGALVEAVGQQLWRPGPKDGEMTTVAADLVEIWDFVHDAKTGN
jgi:hypothetical protein